MRHFSAAYIMIIVTNCDYYRNIHVARRTARGAECHVLRVAFHVNCEYIRIVFKIPSRVLPNVQFYTN